MMIPYGYKQTEVGVIPEDWSVDTIGAVTLSVTNGGNYKNSAQISLYPLIKMGNISRGYINLKKIEYVIGFPPSENDRLTYGDVLLNTRNTPELVGKVAIWKNELSRAYFNSNLLRFNFKLEKSDPFFMNLIFNTEQVISEFRNIAKGTTSVAAIYPQDMLKVKIIIPPLQEQQRIAEALSDVDGMISSLEKLIAKYKSIKTACLQQMFPQNGETVPRMRLPGFTGAWKQRKLGDIGETYTGLSGKTKADFGHGQARFVTYMNVFSNPISNPEMTEPIEIDPKQNEVEVGDVFFTTSSETPEEVGMSSILLEKRGKTYLNSFCFGFRPSEKIDSYYLAYMLRSESARAKITLLAQGISRYNISKNKVMEIAVSLPSLDEQKMIGQYFSQLDNLITLHQRKLEKIQKIKQGMMQQLLTGKIRLV